MDSYSALVFSALWSRVFGQGVTRASLIAPAMIVMNIAAYGFQIAASRLLGPVSYGEFAALMNLLLVLTVAQLALQATTARMISADPGQTAGVLRGVFRLACLSALALGLVLLALSPLLADFLQLRHVFSAVLVAVIAVPLTLVGAQAGVLQGRRDWLPLALVYLSSGSSRLIFGVGFLFWRPETWSAMAAAAVSAWVPVLVAGWATREQVRASRRAPSVPVALVRPVLAAATGLLAYYALSNVDVIIARRVLDEHTAGQYAAGLILVKAVVFLPQFVSVVAFPSLVVAHERRRALILGLSGVAVMGALAVLAAWLLSPLVLVFVGGSAYSGVQSTLWLFAVLGTILAMLQLLMYAGLAADGRGVNVLLWVGFFALVAVGTQADGLRPLLVSVVLLDAVLLVVLIVVALRGSAATAPTTPTQVDGVTHAT